MRPSPEEERAVTARRERRAQRAAHEALTASRDGGAGIAMPRSPGASDPTTVDVGSAAEVRAIDLLVGHHYEIVERNYRCKLGELDIVAIDGDVMVFVEVRSRADDDHGDAIESIGSRKRRLVTRTAQCYLEHRRPDFDEFRFDVVAINGDRIELYQDAWRGGLL